MFTITQFKPIISGLLNHYGGGHHDYTDTNMALSKVRNIIKKLSNKLKQSVSTKHITPPPHSSSTYNLPPRKTLSN